MGGAVINENMLEVLRNWVNQVQAGPTGARAMENYGSSEFSSSSEQYFTKQLIREQFLAE